MPNENSEGDSLVVPRSGATRADEAAGLALAIELDVVHKSVIKLNRPRPATLLGGGSVETLSELIQSEEIELAIVDHGLTPVQQRNLERAWKIKVIDRTALILEIFGERAKTREGVLQVELAHLTYQKGRLVRSWTHLERQRGGGGFMGGPGETQIESDRRLLQGKIDRLKQELEQVIQTRKLHRAKRQKVPYPVVALVGYTNAGKSTLFNYLTGAEVLAADMLFATLDPTLRRLKLPHGTISILSDTVGFISNLPTHLVAAFRATLEEVLEADLILHIRDIADPETNAQAHDVENILRSLGVEPNDPSKLIEVWNKIDLLDPQALQSAQLLTHQADSTGPQKIPVSAITGQGLGELLDAIEARIAGKVEEFDCTLEVAHLGKLDWIYRNSVVVQRRDNDDGSLALTLRSSHQARIELEKKIGIFVPADDLY
ncbi:MAG: GTPase HflX [Rhizobiaceae bacterium]